MKKYRVYFVDGNYIDIQVEGKLEVGAQTTLEQGYYFPIAQLRAVVAHDNLGAQPNQPATQTVTYA